MKPGTIYQFHSALSSLTKSPFEMNRSSIAHLEETTIPRAILLALGAVSYVSRPASRRVKA